MVLKSMNLLQYRDQNIKAIELLRRKKKLSSDMQVYVVEMQLVTSEIDAYEEVADYTTAEMFRQRDSKVKDILLFQ